VWISSGYIRKVSKKCVHWVVLFMDIIQVFCILIDSIRSKHIFKEQEWIIILMLNWWCIIENCYIWIIHFIISNHEKSWNVNGSVSIQGWNISVFWKGSEMLLNLINNLVVIDISSCNNYNIVSVVVCSVVLS
jgi:hypothetical protein